MKWIRSSFCDAGACVEVTIDQLDTVVVRNSKFPEHYVIFDKTEWLAFVEGAKKGEFDATSL